MPHHHEEQLSYAKQPHHAMSHSAHRTVAAQYQDDSEGSAEMENSPPAKLGRGQGGSHRVYDSHAHMHHHQVRRTIVCLASGDGLVVSLWIGWMDVFGDVLASSAAATTTTAATTAAARRG